MKQLKTIRLYGKMGTLFGRVHRLDVSSTAEAIRALCVTVKGFEAYLMNAKDNGMGFAVFLNKRNITEQELCMNTGAEIRIAPILLGSKNSGIFGILLGAALIATSFLFTGTPFLASALFSAGVSLALGGVIQLLSPPPKDKVSKDKPENEPNYAFNGPVNTQAQGHCVPLLYGKMMTGSAVISAGISTDAVPPSQGEPDVKFFAAINNTSDRLRVSDDGATWVSYPQTDFPGVVFQAIKASTDDGNNMVAHDGTDFYFSFNRGVTWGKFAAASYGGKGRRIASGPNGQFMTWYTDTGGVVKSLRSDDGGQTWLPAGTIGISFGNDIEYGNGAYVFAGSGLFTSLDGGDHWNLTLAGNWTGIGYNGTTWLGGGNTGAFAYSSNATAWVIASSGVPNAVYCICGQAGRFHIGTFEGEVWITDTNANVLTKKRNANSQRFYSSACIFRKVVLSSGGGGTDQQYSSQDNGDNWLENPAAIPELALTVSLVQV